MTDPLKPSDMPELKPCPFCGGNGEYDEKDVPPDGLNYVTTFIWQVGCANSVCIAYCLTDSFDRKSEAADAWNNRADIVEQPYGELTIEDYKASFEDHKRLVKELDIALNGEYGAAEQASLCDIVSQVIRDKKQPTTVTDDVPTGFYTKGLNMSDWSTDKEKKALAWFRENRQRFHLYGNWPGEIEEILVRAATQPKACENQPELKDCEAALRGQYQITDDLRRQIADMKKSCDTLKQDYKDLLLICANQTKTIHEQELSCDKLVDVIEASKNHLREYELKSNVNERCIAMDVVATSLEEALAEHRKTEDK